MEETKYTETLVDTSSTTEVSKDTEENSVEINNVEDAVDNNLMLTTIDNPYSPKTEYEMWQFWDNEHNYYTEELLARIADLDVDDTIDEMPNVIDNQIMEAMIFIVENDPQQVYKLV